MSKPAKVLLDTQHSAVAMWQTVEADDWTVVNGLLTMRLDGKEVAHFQHWSGVKWATEDNAHSALWTETKKDSFQTDFAETILHDVIAERMPT